MDNQNNELITIKEASVILNKSPWIIRNNYISKGFLDVEYVNDRTRSTMRVYRNQVEALKNELEKEIASPYGELYLAKDESLKFLDSYNDPHNIRDPRRYMTKCKYGVTNKGRIVNLTHNRILKPQEVDHGYFQVLIGKKFELVHVAVGSQWVPNGKFKSQLHHIDGNRANNNAENLVAVNDEEHDKAHNLMTAAKESGNWTEYNNYIEGIKKDNAWHEDIRVILDPSDDSKDGSLHVWFVTDKGYCDYKAGKRTWDDLFIDGEIRAECYYH